MNYYASNFYASQHYGSDYYGVDGSAPVDQTPFSMKIMQPIMQTILVEIDKATSENCK